MLALLVLRPQALPARTLPLHARSRRGAGVARALAAPRRGAAQRREDLEPGALRQRVWALRRSDGIVVHVEAYRQKLLALGLPPERVAAIPAGVDASWFTPGNAPRLRREWGVPEDAPLAGIVARMKPERGQRVLLRAFAGPLTTCPEAWPGP